MIQNKRERVSLSLVTNIFNGYLGLFSLFVNRENPY